MAMIFRINTLSFLTGLVFLTLFDLLLLNMPLTNLLGYEYSLFNGLFIAILSGFYVISLLKKNTKTRIGENDFRKNLIAVSSGYLLIPLLLGISAAFFIKNCSLFEGILYYLVFTCPAVLIGSSLGFISYFFSRKFPGAIFVLICLLIASIPIAEIYFNPQIFFYNPLAAFYPGTIYDEFITIDLKLLSYRILNILYFGTVFVLLYRYMLLYKYRNGKITIYFTSGLIIIPLLFIYLSGYFGFSSSDERIKRELGGLYRTKHFDIIYDKSLDKKELISIVLHHEYYFDEVSRYLNLRFKKRITTFLFKDQIQKKELMGSESADVAKPWLSQLYIRYDNYRETLQHEIAHCLSAPFGTTIFKVASGINPAMIEGIAMAAENDYDGKTVHFMAGLAYNNNIRIPLGRLFSGMNFFGQYSSISYIYAGSFIRYLIDESGIEKFKKVYSGSDFRDIYGKSLNELSEEYYKFIENEGLGAGRDMAVFYYGRLPIFKKVCARFLAGQIRKGWALYDRGNYKESGEIFRQLLDYSTSYSSLSGYISSLSKQKRFNAAIHILKNNLGRYDSTSYIYALEFLLADLNSAAGNYKEADNIYRKINKSRPALSYVISTELRMFIIKDTSQARSFFSGNDFEKYRLLSKLNKDSIFYPSVPAILSLAETTKMEYTDVMRSFDGRITVKDQAGSYAAYRLSVYALSRLDINGAKFYAVEALKFKGAGEFRDMLFANLKKINWFNNYAGTI